MGYANTIVLFWSGPRAAVARGLGAGLGAGQLPENHDGRPAKAKARPLPSGSCRYRASRPCAAEAKARPPPPSRSCRRRASRSTAAELAGAPPPTTMTGVPQSQSPVRPAKVSGRTSCSAAAAPPPPSVRASRSTAAKPPPGEPKCRRRHSNCCCCRGGGCCCNASGKTT